MSCFVVENETINRAVAGFMHFSGMPENQATKIGHALLTTNIEAFAQRYSHNADAMSEMVIYVGDAEKYVWDGTVADADDRMSLLQIVKSMKCLRYQMSEGKVPETLVFKTLSSAIELAEMDLIERYADKYLRAMKRNKVTVEDLPGYSQCEWG